MRNTQKLRKFKTLKPSLHLHYTDFNAQNTQFGEYIYPFVKTRLLFLRFYIKKGNRKVNDEIIAGTFFVVGFDEHGFIASLSNDNIQKFSERFWQTEEYDDKEVSEAYWNSFIMSIESME